MYMEDDSINKNIRSIVTHTIGEVQPLYDFKNILKILKNINFMSNESKTATVVKTEWVLYYVLALNNHFKL